MREIKSRLKVMLKNRSAGDVIVPYKTDSYLRDNVDTVNIIPPKTEEKSNNVSVLVCLTIPSL